MSADPRDPFTNTSAACDLGRHFDCYGCICDCHAPTGVPVSAEERLSALLHEIECKPTGLALHDAGDPDSVCGSLAARLIAAGVSVPTEPGAPDPLERIECAVCHHWPQARNWPNHLAAYPTHRQAASRPVPAPEPSARLEGIE